MNVKGIINKIIIMLLAVLIISVLKVYILGSDMKDDNFYTTEVEVINPDTSINEISYILMDKYLSHYKSFSVSIFDRLQDYKITKINSHQGVYDKSISNEGGLGITFEVTYSVRPLDANSIKWHSGNGVDMDNRWIVDSYRIIAVSQHGNIYRIEKMATGL